MPRGSHKKRCLLNPHKSQLVFVETPVNGAKHDCGPQLRSAVHPRTFLSEKQGCRRASWVSPQFHLHDVNVAGGGRRKTTRKKSHTASVLLPDRRKAVCKYTPLCFETNTPVSQHRHTNVHTKTSKPVRSDVSKRRTSLQKELERSTARSTSSRHPEISTSSRFHRNEKRASDGFHHTSVSKGSQTPNTSSVLAPADVETPCCSGASSPSRLHLLFPPNQTKTEAQDTSVLVKDTPERDYGLRVTWRRRKALMTSLLDRGQLKLTDARVNNE